MADPAICMVEQLPPECYRRVVADKRGQLDALLDVGLVLPRTDTVAPQDDSTELGAGVQLGRYRLACASSAPVAWARSGTRAIPSSTAAWRSRCCGPGPVMRVARARLVREARAMARLRHPERDHRVRCRVDRRSRRDRDRAGSTARPSRAGSRAATGAATCWRRCSPPAAGSPPRTRPASSTATSSRTTCSSSRGGRVVVTDFGLARAAGDAGDGEAACVSDSFGALDSPLTVTGAVLGTPAYMAPEQLAGRTADERADQFAFCVTLWEALAGSRPFPGRQPAGDRARDRDERAGRRRARPAPIASDPRARPRRSIRRGAGRRSTRCSRR